MQIIAYYCIKDSILAYKNTVLENIAEKDIEFFDIYKTGEIIEKITSAEECINSNFLLLLITLIISVCKFLFLCYYLFHYTKALTIASLLICVFTFTSNYYNEMANM